MKGLAKKFVKGALHSCGYDVHRLYAANSIRPWLDEGEFAGLYGEIKDRTLVDVHRCFMLYQFARQASSIGGDVAEVGVYKGGTARLLARLFGPTGKRLHLFDTFEGMPETNPEKDLHKKGDFDDTSLQAVRRFLDGCGNAEFHPGIFPDTAGPVKGSRFCFVHVDADIYQSVLDSCGFFFPRMEQGGIMLFDDYGFVSCPGARKAVDEFFSGKPESPCYLQTGQCFVVKL